MTYRITITKQDGKYLAGIEAEGAYQAVADTPLGALRKWIHHEPPGVWKPRIFRSRMKHNTRHFNACKYLLRSA